MATPPAMERREEASVKEMTQRQHLSLALKRAAGTNNLFLEMVKGGMTREELQQNINRRPALWRRFSGWLDVLPKRR